MNDTKFRLRFRWRPDNNLPSHEIELKNWAHCLDNYKPFLKSSSSFSLTSDLNLVSLELVRKKVAQEAKKQRLLKVNTNPTKTEAIAPVKSSDFFFSPCCTITRHENTAKTALVKKCKKGITMLSVL